MVFVLIYLLLNLDTSLEVGLYDLSPLKFRALFLIGVERLGSSYLFGSLNNASKSFAYHLIALS